MNFGMKSMGMGRGSWPSCGKSMKSFGMPKSMFPRQPRGGSWPLCGGQRHGLNYIRPYSYRPRRKSYSNSYVPKLNYGWKGTHI